MKKYLTLVFLMVFGLSMLSANNIAISNLSLTGKNITDDYILVQFDISWENSWRTTSAPNNWDAAWVFVKYRITVANGGDGLWKHAWLNNTGNTAPSGSTIDIGLLTPGTAFNVTTNPGLGAFIYRNADGTGTFTITSIQLRWNYGVNYKTGTTPIGDNDVVDIQVYAIEMVYVPQGSFYVGDSTTGAPVVNISGQFNVYNSSAAYQISSESVPTILGGSASGNMRNNDASSSTMLTPDDFNNTTTQSLPAAFPKGFNAFYCMKYEISQQGYVDFLNSLTYTQQAKRTAIAPSSAAGTYLYNTMRNKIKISTSGTNSTVPAIYATDYSYVACNYLAWPDVLAYLDWSGLRPMTELEFEKACRGTVSAVVSEYAWHSTSITQNTGITNSGLTNETSTNSGNGTYGNHASMQGPMRVGAFATSSSTRAAAGATYYGIMDMSGNLWEQTVTVGNATGRLFTGAHGNGALATNGNADALTWPSTDFIGGLSAGFGLRGGSWALSVKRLEVSDRNSAADPWSARGQSYGGRGVRLAP
jgi:formylglycine-generating enzyme required for sulfatase activity